MDVLFEVKKTRSMHTLIAFVWEETNPNLLIFIEVKRLKRQRQRNPTKMTSKLQRLKFAYFTMKNSTFARFARGFLSFFVLHCSRSFHGVKLASFRLRERPGNI